MIGSAFIKDGLINLRFDWRSIPGNLVKFENELGSTLLDFIWMDDKMVDGMFQGVLHDFLSKYNTFSSFDGLLEYMDQYVRKALNKNIYLYFYQSTFIGAIIAGMFDQEHAMEMLREYLLDDSELINIRSNDWKGFAVGACSIITSDIKHRKELLLDDLEVISGENKNYCGYSPLQRMYLLILGGKNYLSGEFTTALLPDCEFEEDASVDTIKKTIETEKVDIVEMTNIDTLNDLIRFELFHTIKENLTIKRCGFCGGYFIPNGRSDIEYCTRIKFGEKKRCSEIGAFRKREKLLKEEPIHKKHNAAVKRMNKRKHTGWISDNEYSAWSKQAIKMRDECLGSKISLEVFEKWLDKTSRANNK